MITLGLPGRWLRRYRGSTREQAQIICFPHAGGGASAFRGWAERLPRQYGLLAVRYPGREDRIADPFPTSIEALADDVTEAVVQAAPRHAVLFGHSLGASVAHEVALRLTGRGHTPLALCVSGRQPPHLLEPTAIGHQTDEELLSSLLELDDAASETLAVPELRELALVALRADHDLADRYRPVAGPRLTCPVLAYTGADDPDGDCMGQWAETTSGPFSRKVLPGGHFYLRAQEGALLTVLTGCIEVLLSGRPGGLGTEPHQSR